MTETDWTIHPGLTWAEVIEESGRSQAEIAEEMGVSAKHLNQIIRCHALPSAETTVLFAQVMDVPVRMMWNLCCNYRLDLALGKKDITFE